MVFDFTELEPISGVYRITNTVNDKVYIGQSRYIQSRMCSHIDDLLSGRHSNKSLQSDFEEHGINAFEGEILEEFCGSNKEMIGKETEYVIRMYDNGEELYNKLPLVLRKQLEKDYVWEHSK